MKKLICVLLSILALLLLLSCEEQPPETAGTDFLSFAARGVDIPLDAEAAPILALLGTPIASAETNSCYGDGKDKIYEYVSFKVQTYSAGGKDYILSVEINSDADAEVATPEGVRVGSTAEEAIAKLGEPSERTDTLLVYFNGTTKTKLQIMLRDGIVTNIQYLKTA